MANVDPIFSDEIISQNNSSIANLGVSGTFTGTADYVVAYNTVSIGLSADQPMNVIVEQSENGTNWDFQTSYQTSAYVNDLRNVSLPSAYLRLVVQNLGVSGTTYFRLQTIFSPTQNNVSSSIQDLQTFNQARVDFRSQLGVASTVVLIGSEQTGSLLDMNTWATSVSGSGSSTVNGGLNTLSTGTTAGSYIFLSSNNVGRYIPGTVNAFYSSLQLGDTGVSNNIKRWGLFDDSFSFANALYFQLNGTVQGIGIRQNGTDIVFTSFNGPYPFVIDTHFHSYEIQYTSGIAYFYQDSKLIHIYKAFSSALTYTPHYYLGFENQNLNNSITNTSMSVRGSAILRYGEVSPLPRFFHPVFTSRVQTQANATSNNQTSLTTTISGTKTGNLIVVVVGVANGTPSVTDGASQTYTSAGSITSGNFKLYVFYKANTTSGVTSVTLSSTTGTALNMIVTEYSQMSASPFDVENATVNSLSALNLTWNSGNITTTQANELLVGAAYDISRNTATQTVGTSWTQVNTIENGAGAGGGIFQEERYVNVTGTYSASGTSSSADTVLAIVASFKLFSGLSTGFTLLNSDTVIKIGPGTLKSIVINTLGTGSASVTFYDGISSTSGSEIGTVSLVNSIGTLDYEAPFNNGLTMVVNSSSADFTVIYD